MSGGLEDTPFPSFPFFVLNSDSEKERELKLTLYAFATWTDRWLSTRH